MKTYTTFAGAVRAANGKPIVRLLDDPREVFIVLDRLDTDIIVYTTDGPDNRVYRYAGSTDALNIAVLAKRLPV